VRIFGGMKFKSVPENEISKKFKKKIFSEKFLPDIFFSKVAEIVFQYERSPGFGILDFKNPDPFPDFSGIPC